MSAPRFLGTHRNTALFESRGKAVFVSTKNLTATVEVGPRAVEAFASTRWSLPERPADPVWAEIASAALKRSLTPSDISLSESTKRTYTVPKRVAQAAASAKTAEGRMTPVAKHVSNLLAGGEQITCADVLWVSRFFENNHEPNMSRATWLAWGGDEGKRWSEGLASRLDYDSVVADAGMYETPGVQDFVEYEDADRAFFAELTAPLAQHAHSLYKVTSNGTWQAWGNGDWVECSEPEQGEQFVELDEEAALFMAGALFDAPDTPVDLRTPNPEAWDLAEAARDEIDWILVDRAMVNTGREADIRSNSPEVNKLIDSVYAGTKAHAAELNVAPGSPVTNDYTPEERSENASGQLRDANGRFANVGDSGAIKSSGIGGTILEADGATGVVKVQGDDGNVYDISSTDFEVGATPRPKVDPTQVDQSKLDLSGIVSPVKEVPQPRATLGRVPEIFGPVKINEAIDNYSEFINATRQENAKEFKKLLNGPLDVTEVSETEALQAAAAPDVPAVAPAEGSEGDEAPPATPDPTPDSSDVTPVYLAIVDREDPRAVMELVALVPSTATSTDPKTFRRTGGKWVEDASVLRDMRSATPPPLVQLDADQYEDVVAQVDMESTTTEGEPVPTATDEETEPAQTITAAGGADRNSGNAEKLRRYWTVGEGGAKIRWDTGGDWTRCVRLLSKHLGNRAKGYCALRHKEMTGVWPGDKKNRELATPALTAGGSPTESTDYLHGLPDVLRASADAAAAQAAIMRVRGTGEFSPIPPTTEDISEGRTGRAFKIPLMIPEGLATGDGRIFGKGALGIRTLPLPLMWQIQTGEGHDGSVLVGKIERVERTPAGLGNAYGVFDTGPYGQEAQRLVESGMLRWISADLDKFEVDEARSDEATGKMFIKKGRAMGATLVPKPAFQECTIELVPIEENEMPLDSSPSAVVASASIANAIPVEPPQAWFERPILNGPTPITVTDEGQVFGHIATWDTDHIGFGDRSVRAPRSASGYAYFHTGVLRTNGGKDIRVGQLTLAGGHAPIHLSADAAVKHYDETRSAIADVHAGEDSYGIYVAGALRPGTTPEQIRSLRASAPSGDWRSINRRLELVAVCQVNVPGFPVPRAMTASAGDMTALVAAGSAGLLAQQVEQSREEKEALVAAARTRLYKVLDVDGYMTEFKDFPKDKREKLAKEGKALKDGSFPIESAADLRRAIHAYGRADDAKKAAVRRHIVKSARKLDKPELIPSDWKEAAMNDTVLSQRDRYENLVASAREEKVNRLRARVNPPSKDELAAQAAALRNRIQK